VQREVLETLRKFNFSGVQEFKRFSEKAESEFTHSVEQHFQNAGAKSSVRPKSTSAKMTKNKGFGDVWTALAAKILCTRTNKAI